LSLLLSGSEHHCKNRQQNLEELCEGIGKENESANSQSEKVITSKRKSMWIIKYQTLNPNRL